MNFERGWVLIFAIVPLLWAAWEWRLSARRLSLGLKVAALIAVILALSEPRLLYKDRKVAVAVLVDTSASVSQQDLAAASSLAARIEQARGGNLTHVIPFARSTRNPSPLENGKSWNFQYTGGDSGHGTNLENAIRDIVVLIKTQYDSAFSHCTWPFFSRPATVFDGEHSAFACTGARDWT